MNRREGNQLLAYLALEQGSPVAYRTLARVFWPYETDARDPDGGDFTNTRQAISSLRKSLGPDAGRLENRGKGIVALQLAGSEVDFVEFDRLVQQGDCKCWEAAVALYRGPLLEGWNSKWVIDARARRLRSYERIVRALVEDAVNSANFAAADGWLRHALLVTAGEESWYRSLLELLARQGRLDASEAEYEALVKLQLQAGKQPEELTTRLITSLRSEFAKLPPSGLIPPPLPLVKEPKNQTPTPFSISPSISGFNSIPLNGKQVTLLYKRGLQPDEMVMRMLERGLKQAGYTVFIDQYVSAGMPWAREIEKRVRNSYGVIALLSEIAAQSEMFDYEIELAYSAAQAQHGLPMLLPIRVSYQAPLPPSAAMADILNPLQQLHWRSADDNDTLLIDVLKALEFFPTPPGPVHMEPIGGGMPVDSPYYIERTTDAEFHQAVSQLHSIVLVKGARQMGKTSLLARALHQARRRGTKVVRTDLQKLNRAQMESPSSFLHALAVTIALQLGLSPPTWEAWDPDLGANLNMEIFLCETVLRSFSGPVVWALDEVDRLFSCDFGSEIFGLFRAWHNERSLDPEGPWSRITLAIAYATEAHLFVSDLNQSPFNVGTHLVLRDFDIAEAEELNLRHGSPLPDRAALERLYSLIGGQPYLMRRALSELATHRMSLDALTTQADTDEGVFGDHLRRLLTALGQDPALAAIVRSILHGEPCPTPESFYRLRSAGVLAGEWGAETKFRCNIYSTYLVRRLQ